jgi:hypothetical protein
VIIVDVRSALVITERLSLDFDVFSDDLISWPDSFRMSLGCNVEELATEVGDSVDARTCGSENFRVLRPTVCICSGTSGMYIIDRVVGCGVASSSLTGGGCDGHGWWFLSVSLVLCTAGVGVDCSGGQMVDERMPQI